jgi:hypothetical protein
MAPTTTQQWTRIRYSDQHIRVSDAERSAVAEQLGRHSADGRLDQAEFDERVSRTMAAKTRGDLAGLFDDLPDTDSTAGAETAGPGGPSWPAAPYRTRRRGGLLRLVILAAIIMLIASAVGHALMAFYVPWFWIAVAVTVVLVTRHHHRHDH